MATLIKLRNDTKARWEQYNPILAEGEIGIEIDTNKQKTGNGTLQWNDLPYMFETDTDYNTLVNKPSINNIELAGNKTLDELGIQSKSPSDNNLYGLMNGELYKVSGIAQHDLYIDKTDTNEISDGSRYFPFKTISAAINSAQSDVATTFRLQSGGEYVEAITVNNDSNWTFLVDGARGQYRTSIKGDIIVSGTSTSIGFKNIQVDSDIIISSTVGNIYFDDIYNKGLTTFSAESAGYYHFRDCEMVDDVEILGPVNLRFDETKFDDESVITINNANATVIFKNCPGLSIKHLAGNIIIVGDDSTLVLSSKLDTTFPFVSTATTGLIDFIGGSARNPSTLQLLPISISGSNISYSLGKFEFEPTNSVLSGTRLDGGLHSLQIYDHKTRDSYTPTNVTLEGHLDGINNALKEIIAKLPVT